MSTKATKQKDPAAVALGRKGGKKGGPARAAKLTPEQRSESARRAVQARWAKARERQGYMLAKRRQHLGKTFREFQQEINEAALVVSPTDTSDRAVLTLLKRIKMTDSPSEIRQLSGQLERVIFHKQYGH